MALVRPDSRETPEGVDYNDWLRLEQELDEILRRRRVKRVAEKLVREAPRIEAESSKDPTDQLMGERLAISREQIAHHKQELDTRQELQDYFLARIDYQITEAAFSLSELQSWGVGYNTGVDVKRNFLERQLAQLRKDRRDTELRTWEDVVQIRKGLREALKEYRELRQRYKMMEYGEERGG